MEKEDIGLVAQLLTGMKDAVQKMKVAKKKNDLENMKTAKEELLNFQKQVDQLI